MADLTKKVINIAPVRIKIEGEPTNPSRARNPSALQSAKRTAEDRPIDDHTNKKRKAPPLIRPPKKTHTASSPENINSSTTSAVLTVDIDIDTSPTRQRVIHITTPTTASSPSSGKSTLIYFFLNLYNNVYRPCLFL
jgi:hypothetical protein